MDYDNITADNIIILSCESMPTVFWKIDSNSFQYVRTLKDVNGGYLWSPHVDKYSQSIGTSPGTLIGIPIVVVPCKEGETIFQIETHFPNGESVISKTIGQV
jgi:HK97 family phage major capsid protein